MNGIAAGWVALLLLGGAEAPAAAPCRCEAARETNGWCEAHEVGYVGSVPIKSRKLHDALDAHGHDVDASTFACDACRKAIEADGFCEEHRIGFVAGRAYFSRLTHVLARGTRRSAAEISCPVCRKNAAGRGWCESCGVGMVGAIAIADRADFEQAAKALRIVEQANEAALRCEDCAVAMVTDTWCPVCRITYRDGRGVAVGPPGHAGDADRR